jgi:hypothetical protein
MPAVESGTVYDIISKICDHELAEVVTSKMIKHDQVKAKENENDDQAKAQEKENEEREQPEDAQDQRPEQPQPPRGRQSLGEYFISHPPITYAPLGQAHSEEEELEGYQAPPDVPGYQDDQPRQQDKVSCLVFR